MLVLLNLISGISFGFAIFFFFRMIFKILKQINYFQKKEELLTPFDVFKINENEEKLCNELRKIINQQLKDGANFADESREIRVYLSCEQHSKKIIKEVVKSFCAAGWNIDKEYMPITKTGLYSAFFSPKKEFELYRIEAEQEVEELVNTISRNDLKQTKNNV